MLKTVLVKGEGTTSLKNGDNDMRCIIVSAGFVGDLGLFAGMIAPDTRVICADGGAKHVADLGFVPDVIIGDMDSLKPRLLLAFTRQGSRIKQYPTAKDETDTALALTEALADAPDEIIILGALGTRFDHALANVHLLRMAAEKGVQTKIIDPYNEISLITPRMPGAFKGLPGEVFSLLPLTEEVQGITVTGARWPLEDDSFYIGLPYGVSNEVLREEVKISVKSGLLLLIRVREEGDMLCRCGS